MNDAMRFTYLEMIGNRLAQLAGPSNKRISLHRLAVRFVGSSTTGDSEDDIVLDVGLAIHALARGRQFETRDGDLARTTAIEILHP